MKQADNPPQLNDLTIMKKQIQNLASILALAVAVVSASAQTDVLSLYNSPAQDYTYYSFDVTATNTTTWLTFLFRQDPAYWALDDVSLALASDPNNNLLNNGGFETGNLPNWELVGQQGLPAAGVIVNSSLFGGYGGYGTRVSHSGDYWWFDGAVGGVDGIAQSVDTAVGQDYILSFWLAADGGGTASFDAFIGAQVTEFNGEPILYDIPEPSTFALAGFGVLCLALFRRRKA